MMIVRDDVCSQHNALIQNLLDLSKQIAETRSLLVRAIITSTATTVSAISILLSLGV